MQELLRVKAAYDTVDALIQTQIAEALTRSDTASEARLESTRALNDYAYFVVLFSQFERIVKAKFKDAVDRRRNNPDWTQRRGWDYDLFNSDRVPFNTQIASVLDRKLPEYRQVITFYQQRNHIAHGGLSPIVGSVDVFVREITTIISRLSL